MKQKKERCQETCDSLSVAETRVWEIIHTQDAEWTGKRTSIIVVGSTPVPTRRNVKTSGSILTAENGQRILTSYINVPVGAYIVQKPIYEPDKFEKNYRPSLVNYKHYILANEQFYELEHFDLID